MAYSYIKYYVNEYARFILYYYDYCIALKYYIALDFCVIAIKNDSFHHPITLNTIEPIDSNYTTNYPLRPHETVEYLVSILL